MYDLLIKLCLAQWLRDVYFCSRHNLRFSTIQLSQNNIRWFAVDHCVDVKINFSSENSSDNWRWESFLSCTFFQLRDRRSFLLLFAFTIHNETKFLFCLFIKQIAIDSRMVLLWWTSDVIYIKVRYEESGQLLNHLNSVHLATLSQWKLIFIVTKINKTDTVCVQSG